ncbi:MAG: Calx-beta domain-containing protein [Spirosomataceae bacterium]
MENNTTLDFGFRVPTVVTINDVVLNEGSGGGSTNFTFTVSRDNTSEAFSLGVNTANITTTGSDFTAISGGTVSFTAGGSLTASVSVTVNADDIVELTETFNVLLSGAPDGVIITDGTGLGTITNDDQATISIDNVSDTEGNVGTKPFTFTVTSNKAVDVPFSVNINTVNGTASTVDNDYVANSTTLNFSGTVSETKTFTVTVNGDVKVESDETFSVPLSALSASGRNVVISGSNGTGSGTITNDDAATISINDVSQVEGNAGTTNFVFTVTLSQVVDQAVTVNFATADGTASSGDYNTNTGIVTFPANGAGQNQTITVQVIGDMVGEANETFFVNLSNVSAGGKAVTISDAQGIGTIIDDDLAFSINDVSVSEGNAGTTTMTFTVTRTSTATAESIQYTTANNTATTADNDYVASSGTLNFALGDNSETITIIINGDTKVEANETFFVNLSNVSNGSIADGQGQGTITNDDAATVTLTGGIAQAEGNAGTTSYTFTATLNNEVQDGLTIAYTTNDGTATAADGDYVDNDGPALVFAGTSGETKTITVLVNGDTKVEANETFTVSLGAISNAPVGVTVGGVAQTGTITNDDAATVTLSGGPLFQNEGNVGTTPYAFTVTLNNAVQGGFSVSYTTDDNQATTADNDYVDNDGSLVFTGTAGESKTITVLVNGDLKVEANEIFLVSLGALTGAPAGVTTAGSPQQGLITNDELDWGDAPDSYNTLSANNGARHNTSLLFHLGATVDGDLDGQPNANADGDDTDAEGDDDDGVTLPSALVTNTMANLTVNATSVGYLNAWVDFNNNGNWSDVGEQVFTNTVLTAGDNTLSFMVPAGATPATTFARFRYTSASIGSPSFAGQQTTGEVEDYQVSIVNTQFSINDVSMVEGNAGTTNLNFTISRSVNANACSVNYGITGGSAVSGSDYQAFSNGTVNFTAGGALSETVTVVINGDNTVELNETILMTLSMAVNGSILDGSGTGTITNDDASVITITSPTVTEVNPGPVSMSFDIVMSQPSDADVVVNYATVDGTATTAGNDYQSTSGMLTFSAGQTSKQVSVTINGDCINEMAETLLLRLSGLNANGRNVSLSGGGATLEGTGTIQNAPLPTAMISGTSSVCQDAPSPTVTFTGSGGMAPYTFTYSVNGGGSQFVSTMGMSSSATVAQSTAMAGVYTYTLVSVSDANCSQAQSGMAVITVKPTPSSALTASKYDVCPNTPVSLDAHCSVGGATVNWNPGGATVTPDAPNIAYVYKASCVLDGCIGNESSVEVRTHRILVDLKDVGLGAQPKAIVGAVKDNLAPTNLIVAPLSPRLWTLLATGCTASESAVFKLSGPISFNTIDNNPPYAMFANVGSDYFSVDHPNYGNGSSGFPNGTYTLVVDLRAADGVGGPFPKNRIAVGTLLATRTLQFTINNTIRQGISRTRNGRYRESWAVVVLNPVVNTLRLKLQHSKDELVEVAFLDASGRSILQRIFVPATNQHQEEFEMSSLANGMYFLRVSTVDKHAT